MRLLDEMGWDSINLKVNHPRQFSMLWWYNIYDPPLCWDKGNAIPISIAFRWRGWYKASLFFIPWSSQAGFWVTKESVYIYIYTLYRDIYIYTAARRNLPFSSHWLPKDRFWCSEWSPLPLKSPHQHTKPVSPVAGLSLGCPPSQEQWQIKVYSDFLLKI